MALYQIELPDELAAIARSGAVVGFGPEGLIDQALVVARTLHAYERSYRHKSGEPLTEDELRELAVLFRGLGRYIQSAHGINRDFVSQEEQQRRTAKAERSWQTRRARNGHKPTAAAGNVVSLADRRTSLTLNTRKDAP